MNYFFTITTTKNAEELDLDCYAEFDYKVTYGGAPERWPSWTSPGEPAEPLEFDIENLECFIDDGNENAALPKELWPDDLEYRIQSDSKIYETIHEEHTGGYHDDER